MLNSPVRRSSLSARAGVRSRITRLPWASLVVTCTPCSPARSCPGTVKERSSVPSPVNSKIRDGRPVALGFT
ncbi:MAG: hypothetical protein WKF40_08645 [Thermoleophilaceae bacterium]